ncbi:hypothetical protein IWX90DRAFT_4252 [Phyllosticta citrichinensis]|uniref:Uncharacterized protein n=1 Tax=Phyllosticta citrichinensis TaxID=1130410 RepID=A0ABR1Y523_9PEZI
MRQSSQFRRAKGAAAVDWRVGAPSVVVVGRSGPFRPNCFMHPEHFLISPNTTHWLKTHQVLLCRFGRLFPPFRRSAAAGALQRRRAHWSACLAGLYVRTLQLQILKPQIAGTCCPAAAWQDMAAAEATTTHCLFTAHMAPLSVGACVERYLFLFSSLAYIFARLAGWLLAHHRNLDMPCATSDANTHSSLVHTAAVRQSGRMPREGRSLMPSKNLATRGCSQVWRRRRRRKSCWRIGVQSYPMSQCSPDR